MTLKELIIFGAYGVMVSAQNNTITSNSTLTSNSTETDFITSISFDDMIKTEFQPRPATDYDFLKEHSCNCPAVFDEFAIGGMYNGTADDMDTACHGFRRCMGCVAADASCAGKDIKTLPFNWDDGNVEASERKESCATNEDDCAAKKCECHIQFKNTITPLLGEAGEGGGTAKKVDINECEHAPGNKDKCCLVDNNWMLYNSNDQKCGDNEVVTYRKMSDGCVTENYVDTSRDYSIAMTIKTADTNRLPAKTRWLLRVGSNKYETLPALYYKYSSRNFLLKYNCGGNTYANRTNSPEYDFGLAQNSEITIKIEVLTSQGKMIIYNNGVNHDELNIKACNRYPSASPAQVPVCYGSDTQESYYPLPVDSVFDYEFKYLN